MPQHACGMISPSSRERCRLTVIIRACDEISVYFVHESPNKVNSWWRVYDNVSTCLQHGLTIWCHPFWNLYHASGCYLSWSLMHLMFVPVEMMLLIYYYVCVFCAIYVCNVRLAIMNVLPVCLWNCVFSCTCVSLHWNSRSIQLLELFPHQLQLFLLC